MLGEHLTSCWCWEKLTPDNVRLHMVLHKAYDEIESFNIMLIAWEVAHWEPTNRKDIT